VVGEQYRALLDAGAHGFWHDMNEPTTFAVDSRSWPPLETRHAMKGAGPISRPATSTAC
jgi:alpha-glucosidase